MLKINGYYLAGHRKWKFFQFCQKITKINEKPFLLDFVNWSTILSKIVDVKYTWNFPKVHAFFISNWVMSNYPFNKEQYKIPHIPKMFSECLINCFCGMVDRRKVFSLISSRDHCQRSSPSRICDMPRLNASMFTEIATLQFS